MFAWFHPSRGGSGSSSSSISSGYDGSISSRYWSSHSSNTSRGQYSQRTEGLSLHDLGFPPHTGYGHPLDAAYESSYETYPSSVPGNDYVDDLYSTTSSLSHMWSTSSSTSGAYRALFDTEDGQPTYGSRTRGNSSYPSSSGYASASAYDDSSITITPQAYLHRRQPYTHMPASASPVSLAHRPLYTRLTPVSSGTQSSLLSSRSSEPTTSGLYTDSVIGSYSSTGRPWSEESSYLSSPPSSMKYYSHSSDSNSRLSYPVEFSAGGSSTAKNAPFSRYSRRPFQTGNSNYSRSGKSQHSSESLRALHPKTYHRDGPLPRKPAWLRNPNSVSVGQIGVKVGLNVPHVHASRLRPVDAGWPGARLPGQMFDGRRGHSKATRKASGPQINAGNNLRHDFPLKGTFSEMLNRSEGTSENYRNLAIRRWLRGVAMEFPSPPHIINTAKPNVRPRPSAPPRGTRQSESPRRTSAAVLPTSSAAASESDHINLKVRMNFPRESQRRPECTVSSTSQSLAQRVARVMKAYLDGQPSNHWLSGMR